MVFCLSTGLTTQYSYFISIEMICLETAVKIISQFRYVVEQALVCRMLDFVSYSSCSVLKFEYA